MARASDVSGLVRSGWRSKSVKDELRLNVIARLRENRPILPGIVGYEQTVTPQVVNALLSGHDFILLGLRGQAKTRLLRMLVRLLDPEIPVLAGSELNEDPFQPITKFGRRIVAEKGDATPISWLPRAERYRAQHRAA